MFVFSPSCFPRALEIAGRFDATGGQLPEYIYLFLPRCISRFRAQRYCDRVLIPTITCLKCTPNLEELYLQKADSPAVTPYLLAYVLKSLGRLRVVALPRQSDDDVVAALGNNCPRLEAAVLTGTAVTNLGLAWLLCCRRLHTVVLRQAPGVSPKGVALLLRGLPNLSHVVCDALGDVLAYVDFNTAEDVTPRFGLKTVLFPAQEHLSSNHLELVAKMCPDVEWLSLDSANFFSLEGLGRFPRLSLLRLNYKGRPIDATVEDFLEMHFDRLTTLQGRRGIPVDAKLFILARRHFSFPRVPFEGMKSSRISFANLYFLSFNIVSPTFNSLLCVVSLASIPFSPSSSPAEGGPRPAPRRPVRDRGPVLQPGDAVPGRLHRASRLGRLRGAARGHRARAQAPRHHSRPPPVAGRADPAPAARAVPLALQGLAGDLFKVREAIVGSFFYTRTIYNFHGD